MSESIRWLHTHTHTHTHRAKLHLNNIKTNDTNVEKEWENLQYLLKSVAYKRLG